MPSNKCSVLIGMQPGVVVGIVVSAVLVIAAVVIAVIVVYKMRGKGSTTKQLLQTPLMMTRPQSD